jgi:hypothetical protein
MSSALTTITDLADELEDPGVVASLHKHLADGCPLAPLVECVTPQYDHEDRARVIAAMVERAREVIAHQNEHAANSLSDDNQLPTAPKRGRPKSEKREAIQRVARERGESESTVRRQLASLEPAEVIVPKPIGMDKLFQRAHELLCEAQSILEPIKADIEALRGDFDKKDGRWALLGCVAQAVNEARLGAEYVAQARGFRDAMERAKHMKGGNKRPVGAFDVVKGQDLYRAASHERAADPEAMAHQERWRHKTEEDDKNALEQSRRLASERPQPMPPLGLTDPPKRGLVAPKKGKSISVVDEEGRPLLPAAEETANAWADAARVGVGPSEDDDAW